MATRCLLDDCAMVARWPRDFRMFATRRWHDGCALAEQWQAMVAHWPRNGRALAAHWPHDDRTLPA